jgi:sigma-E factor negative regulatory protein RseC
MLNNDCYIQNGIVKEVINQTLVVSVLSKSACASCQSKTSCTSFETKEKIITTDIYDPDLKPGDEVIVKMHKSLGPKAIFLGYGLPFIFFITGLLLFSFIFKKDVIVGLGALLVLTLYYIILNFFKKKVQSTFRFEVERS